MVFSSLLFLFRFLPVAMLLYYITPRKWKNTLLFGLSLVFYSWGEFRYLPLMIVSVMMDYFISLGIEKNRHRRGAMRGLLALSMFTNLFILFFFKYSGFFAQNLNSLFGLSLPVLSLTLPLGISFYTFQTMSYSIDVYRGTVSAERNFIDFGTFVVLFPQLVAGPIVRYTDINRELKERTINLEQIDKGVKQFILGMASKVLIANNIGALWTELEGIGFGGLSTALSWLGITAYGLQIYFDFSGYSLMAIGLGSMLGFDFPRNFNFPYIAKSASEFWRRWHITLGAWFREYLYFPMGGSKKGFGRTVINLFVVWAATGFWHGANWNFVLWGLYFFLLLVIERLFLLKFLDRHRVFAHCYLLFAVLVSWALFAVTDTQQLGVLFSRMFGFYGGSDFVYYLRNYAMVFIAGFVFATPILAGPFRRITQNKWVSALIYGALFAVCVAYLVDATYNPFLYFRF